MYSSRPISIHYLHGLKYHEIIECAVKSVCYGFDVADWRLLLDKKYYYNNGAARWAIMVLLCNELRCTSSSVNKFCRLFGKDNYARGCRSLLHRKMDEDINIAHCFEISRLRFNKKIQELKDANKAISDK